MRAAIWFGINDIEITWRRGEEFPPMLESIFGEFQDGVDRLYDLGGELTLSRASC